MSTTCKLADSCQQIIDSKNKEIEKKDKEIEKLERVVIDQENKELIMKIFLIIQAGLLMIAFPTHILSYKNMATILEKGTITLHTRDLLRYAVDCDSLMKDIGNFITKDIVIPSDKGYHLVFYPLFEEKDNFFAIHYDKDLNYRFYVKNDTNISKDMRYMILKS